MFLSFLFSLSYLIFKFSQFDLFFLLLFHILFPCPHLQSSFNYIWLFSFSPMSLFIFLSLLYYVFSFLQFLTLFFFLYNCFPSYSFHSTNFLSSSDTLMLLFYCVSLSSGDNMPMKFLRGKGLNIYNFTHQSLIS